MKKWEDQQKQKQHQSKIKNAKSPVTQYLTTAATRPKSAQYKPRPVSKKAPSTPSSSQDSMIPASYIIQKQQYFPTNSIYTIQRQGKQNNTFQIQQGQQRPRPNTQTQQKTFRISKLGCDFFKDENDVENDFSKTLDNILQKYQTQQQSFWNAQKPPYRTAQQLPKTDSTADTNQTNFSRQRSIPQQNPQNDQKKQVPPKQIKQPEPKTNQNDNFKLPVFRKQAQDDIVIIHQYKEGKIDTQLIANKDQRLIRNLEKRLLKTQKRKPNKFEDDEDDNVPKLDMSQIKLMYQSYDSGLFYTFLINGLASLTSTLINLDVEEMSNCLAQAILKHIQYTNKKTQFCDSLVKSQKPKQNSDLSQNPVEEPTYIQGYNEQQSELFQSKMQQEKQNLRENDKKQPPLKGNIYQKNSLGAISEKTFETSHNNHETNKLMKLNAHQDYEQYENSQQSNNFLQESLLLKQEYQSEEEDDYLADNLYEVNSSEENDGMNDTENLSPMKQKYGYQQNSLESIYFVSNRFQDSLQYEDEDSQVYQQCPEYNYTESYGAHIHNNNVEMEDLLQSRFDFVEEEEDEKELRVLFKKAYNDSDKTLSSAIPTQEVITNYCKNIIITSKMEKEVTIICLIYIERLLLKTNLGMSCENWRKITFISLIWDDESFENDNFSKAFPQFSTKNINELERIFLQLLDYNLYIKSSDYAKYYFILRTFTESRKKSFPLKPLDLNTIIKLQRNSNRAQRSLKETYTQPNNKSF